MTGRSWWVWVDQCGCPRAAVDGGLANTEAAAWQELDLPHQAVASMRRDGLTATRVGNGEYLSQHASRLTTPGYACPHVRVA